MAAFRAVYNFLWGDLVTLPLPGGGSVGLSLLVLLLIPAGVYFTVILLFALGAGAGCLTAGRLGVRAVWVCCPLLLISFLLMFLRERKPRFSGDPCTGDSPKKS